MGFDVVVVGAGSAGCVLAARLSEDASRRVLLLEAGPDYARRKDLPPEIADGSYPNGSHDWGLRSEPDGERRALDLLRARVTGGCSATNACLALRGSPADYDGWSDLGNPGWSFDEVLPWFRASETDMDFPDSDWHGSCGPLPIRRETGAELAPVPAAALEAATALGYPAVADQNRPWAVGAGPMPVNRVGGVRMSTALTYLAAARTRPNLTIRPGAMVDRVLIDGGRATRIRLAATRAARIPQTIEAGTVVLAAGAFGTPAILLRSGLGPAGDLADLGVPLVRHLPGVGRSLIDHVWISVDAPALPGPPPAPLAQVLITTGTGSLEDGPAGRRPELQLVPCSARPCLPRESPTGAVLFVGVSVLSPRSRGRVWLRSPDPAAAPRIDPGHLRHPEDMARAVEGVLTARRLLRTAPLSRQVAGGELKPAPGVPDDDPAGLAAGIRATFGTYHHPVGTCRMGPDPAEGAVVDARGRVHCVEGLYVADASVMPDIPSANTNLPTIMVAERIASWLLEG